MSREHPDIVSANNTGNRPGIFERLKKPIAATLAVGAGALAFTFYNNQIDKDSSLVGNTITVQDTEVNFNSLVFAAVGAAAASGAAVNRRRRLFKDTLEFQQWASPIEEQRLANERGLKLNLAKETAAISAAGALAVSGLLVASDLEATTTTSEIDKVNMIIQSDLSTRSSTDGQEPAVIAAFNGALQINKELAGVDTSYTAASGGGHHIGNSDGSTEQDNLIVQGAKDFMNNPETKSASREDADINNAITVSWASQGPEHTILIGNWVIDSRGDAFLEEANEGVTNISLIGVNPSTEETASMINLVGEEDYYVATDRESIQEAISEIVDDNSLKRVDEVDVSEKFETPAKVSAAALAVGILAWPFIGGRISNLATSRDWSKYSPRNLIRKLRRKDNE